MAQNPTQELCELFTGEAEELIRTITQNLVEMEGEHGANGALDPALQKAVLRAAHTLKGSAAAFGARRIEVLMHDFETCASALSSGLPGGGESAPAAFDLLYRLLDETETEIVELATGERAAPAALANEADLRRIFGATLELKSFSERREGAELPESGVTQAGGTPLVNQGGLQGSFRVASAKIDKQLAHTDDLLRLRGEGHARSSETKGLLRAIERASRAPQSSWGTEWPKLLGLARDLERRLDGTARRIESLSEVLTEDLLSLRMLPMGSLLSGLERAVRDAARQGEKRVKVQTSGADNEVDRDIAETLRVALLHIVRNAVDHGIETPAERARSGKAEVGMLSIHVDGSGGRLVVRVADDGRGLDVAAIRAKAKARGLACDSDEEAYALVFEPGFTTKSTVTETSGRGVGLDAVRAAVEQRGGTVTLGSEPGKGTEISLTFPSARLTVRVVVMRSGSTTCALPASHVERVVRLSEAARVSATDPSIVVGDRAVALFSLPGDAALAAPRGASTLAVVLRAGHRRAALLVDDVEGDQDVVVGPLSPVLGDVRELSGAAALADGRVVAVLRGTELIETLERGGASAPSSEPSGPVRKTHRVLVVDDSVTTRTLEKSILEAEGYVVEVAVSGVDALERLRRGTFDLMVSDVEMPEMNGLELVRRVRQGPHAELPVILMSSLAKDEDRARGLAAGANEYLIKSEFQQARLLATLERLL